ncbi:fimbrial protein [Pantoea sp. B_10]|uniref:fimbrial protein n=1 Tax=Pantoea sp. B_10 TaxID=2608006 RepID=UPI001CC1C51D|nr:fimbrial protein [Pantoea sp. B_10]
MKKIILAALMPVLMVAASDAMAGDPAPAQTPITIDGGKINFSGSIVATPCAVDNDSDGQTVKLGQVPANHFSAAGDTSAAVPFSIKLTGCVLDKDATGATANYTGAAITFKGTAVSGKADVLALSPSASGAGDETKPAANVGIQILQNGTAVAVDGSKASAKKTSRKALSAT